MQEHVVSLIQKELRWNWKTFAVMKSILAKFTILKCIFLSIIWNFPYSISLLFAYLFFCPLFVNGLEFVKD